MKPCGLKKFCSRRLRHGLVPLGLAALTGLSLALSPMAVAAQSGLTGGPGTVQLAEGRDDRQDVTRSAPSRPKIEETEAQRELEAEKEALSEPLETTVTEGGILGGLLGGLAVNLGGKKTNVAVPTGVMLGSLAGKYVAAKQKKYGEEVEVIEAITKDVQDKNAHAENAIVAMKTVLEEDRARLTELRQALEKGEVEAEELEEMVEVAERDLKTMQVATAKTEEHLETFVKARSIVLEDSDNEALAEREETKAMDAEIDTLRERIQTMHDLVGALSEVS